MCLVRLTREAKLNALSEELCGQLLAALASDAVSEVAGGGHRRVGAGVLGRRRPHASSGIPAPRTRSATTAAPGRIWEALPALPQPSIAAISGYAIGGGLELALSADLRVCDSTASFGFPEVSLGILPSAGGLTRLTRLIGVARAKELILLGERFGPDRALELGVVNRVVDEGQAEQAALEWARTLAAAAAHARWR